MHSKSAKGSKAIPNKNTMPQVQTQYLEISIIKEPGRSVNDRKNRQTWSGRPKMHLYRGGYQKFKKFYTGLQSMANLENGCCSGAEIFWKGKTATEKTGGRSPPIFYSCCGHTSMGCDRKSLKFKKKPLYSISPSRKRFQSRDAPKLTSAELMNRSCFVSASAREQLGSLKS